MTFEQIIALLTTYQGRINRAKFWIAVAIYFVVYILIAAIVSVIFSAFTDEDTGGMTWIILVALLTIPLSISGIFVGIKRLHDRGKSGWWLLVFMFGPVVLSMLGAIPVIGMIFLLAAFGINIWALVELGCLKGDTGPNAYGPDPLQS